MAVAAILEFTFLVIIRPLLHRVALSLMQKLKLGSQSESCHQNSHVAKIQDGGGRHFEINFRTNSHQIWHRDWSSCLGTGLAVKIPV